jgi:arylsulfatase A-like enzyme
LADRAIGRILEKIDDLGLWDDTIVCITSDHGTSLGDHGRTGKSSVQKDDTLYWPLTTDLSHVPLLLGGGDVPKGGVRDFIVNPADVLPTLLELAGVDADHPEPFHGRSFASPLKNAGQSHRAYTVGNRHESSFATLPSLTGMKNPRSARKADSNNTPFIITERWGLAPIGEHGRPQLYDLSADSRCEHDVYDDERATAKDLLDLFFEQMKEADAKPESLDFWQDALQAAMKI